VETEAIVAVVILAVVVAALVKELASPAAIVVGGLVLFVIVGIVPPEQAFLGFANPATISVAGLFVVARAIREHAGLDRAVARLLGDADGPRAALVRLLPPVTLLSGVVNNTPLVATSGPIVRDWAERRGVAATHLLIPLSFAAIVGGLLTTIGTSPNLVVSGVLQAAGHPGLGFFTITPVGLPIAIVGVTLLVVLGPRLLPDRRSPHEQIAGDERDYTVRLSVARDSPIAGRSVADAGLRTLETTYLASIFRDGHEIAPVPPQATLEGGDELVFVGKVSDIRDLLDHPGLTESEQPQTRLLDGDGHVFVECVVGATSPLVGRTLKQVSFRGHYGGVVVAIHRSGERVEGKLGAVPLRAGDALLVLADPAFTERWRGREDFAVVVGLDGDELPSRQPYRWLTLGTLGGMIVLAATGVVPIVTAILLACAVLVAARAISFQEAIEALDRDVLLIVGAAIGLGAAMQTSGLAGDIAGAIERIAAVSGPLVALAAIVVGTLVLTELVTNVAAAALMVPIALDTATRVDVDPVGFAVAVAMAASSSFLTPIGYQTNTIVHGLGGYRFTDYWRLGLPMAASTLVVSLLVVPAFWG
jgi:di/tricarboxylate transporter